MEKTILKITGMSCAHCVNKIETALQGLPGVANAKVKYDETVQTLDNLMVAGKEVGYEAKPIK